MKPIEPYMLDDGELNKLRIALEYIIEAALDGRSLGSDPTEALALILEKARDALSG